MQPLKQKAREPQKEAKPNTNKTQHKTALAASAEK